MRPLAVLFALLVPQIALAQTPGPRIFYTDLESGPGTGGESNLGAFVTIVGRGFGATQAGSAVTVGGGPVGAYRSWSNTEVVVQLGPSARTGSLVLRTAGGTSNGVPVTVRPGGIYFVAVGGSDSNPGSFQAPWATIVHAKNAIAAGDIVYIRDGVSQSAEDNYGAALSVETSGAEGSPKALVAYPGAVVTVGSTAPGMMGLRIPNLGIPASDWVIAGIRFLGEVNAIELGATGSTRWRVARNDISCPLGDGQTGCFAASQTTFVAFLGNQVHDVSSAGPQPSKQYHAVYFTTDSNHVEVGHNHIHDNRTCRAIQFHSSPLCAPDCGSADTTGFNQYDLVVHDNLVDGDVCDGINFATVDPSRGPVQAYNNVILRTGQGPDPPDGSANYAGIYVAAGTNNGADGTGTVEIFNNTLYANGTAGGVDAGQIARGPGSPGLVMSLRNNIVYSVAGEDYLAPATDTGGVAGANNLFFGDGAAPSFLSNNVEDDPDFVDAAAGNFHLLGTSPALNAAAAPVPAADFDGVPRPQGAGSELGAYELPQ